ncbi:MAG TPA: phage minor head protein [Pyrinomonadaceae bacterium]|nr:phage minor head protein [Pyrinomonadaceae bacterium]
MPDIFDLAERFKRRLIARERRSASEMVRVYARAWDTIREQLGQLTRQMDEARSKGEQVSPSWLFRRDRLEALLVQVEEQINKFGQYADKKITGEQAEAIAAARADAGQLMSASLGETPAGVEISFTQLPVGAVENMAGFLSDGTPLRRLLDQLGPTTSRAVRDALIQGVTLGHGPRKIARAVKEEMGGSLTRALKISRTEVIRAYRETSYQTYQKNADVLGGWVWLCTMSARSCPACIAMNGTVHTLDERLDDHVNGACTMVPQTKSWEELGFHGIEDTRPQIESGEDWFARQDEETQRRVLGDAGLAAYKDGAVKLKDFVGVRHSAQWGSMRYAKSLREVLGETDARRYRMKSLVDSINKRPVNTDGLRNEQPLTGSQIKKAVEYAKSLGMPADHIIYSERMNTGHSTLFGADILYIGTDVMPGEGGGSANSRISMRGALAHEIVGHREAALAGRTQEELWAEEVQASVRAAKLAHGLTDEERETLMRDAEERLAKEGKKIDDLELWLGRWTQ